MALVPANGQIKARLVGQLRVNGFTYICLQNLNITIIEGY
jgi:hypothetical protein